MFRLSVPSKTYLVGEYVSLSGGPAIVLSTSPRFVLTATESSSGSYHNNSSSKSLRDLLPRFGLGRFRLEFYDPHEGLGGFGASGAEVLLLAALRRVIGEEDFNSFDLLKDVENAKKEIGWSLGSGYDVLAMNSGMISFIEKRNQTLETMPWPFENIRWVILRGTEKIPTHAHLSGLVLPNTRKLEDASRGTLRAFRVKDESGFVEGVDAFSKELSHLDLTHKSVMERLKEIRDIDGVVTAKGCGALGLDTQLVFYKKEKEEFVCTTLASRYDLLDFYLSPGLKIEKSI